MKHATHGAVALLLLVCSTVSGYPTLGVLTWNIHWQCGSSATCREDAAVRLANLTKEAGAEVVVAIELELNASTPLALPSRGFLGWTQVAGSCPGGTPEAAGDALALAFAPTYSVLAQGGGCLNEPEDSSRAFAVALVKPPFAICRCEALCVIAVHAPHKNITQGQDTVVRVCGAAADSCAVAAGDWNTNIDLSHWPKDRPPLLNPLNASQLWSQLVPNSEYLQVQTPDEVTCCFPEDKYYGYDDHVLSNVVGVTPTGTTIFPYQMKAGGIKGNDTEEHRPVLVNLTFTGNSDERSVII